MNRYLFEKGQTFSIRKLTVGVASVMVGLAFFASGTALAEEARVDSTGSLQNVEKFPDSGRTTEGVKLKTLGSPTLRRQGKMRK